MQKNKSLVMISLIFIILAAFAVRFYNFDEWLYFKMDQARDAMLIDSALKNGPGYLPLLGPRAGATEVDSGYLRLGPAYYYMQYIAGVLSGGNLPMSNAYPDLFFSIAVLPLLYLFTRLYFSRFNSLLIVAMYAFSFLIIEYSRFAWNPNPLPFFFILVFYGLLRFFSEKSFKKSIWWISLWSFGLAIGAQLHFFGFFSLLGISGLMFLWHWEVWKAENWKGFFSKAKIKSLAIFSSVALGVFLLVSSPIIVSDIYRNGENSKNFLQALGSKPEKRPFFEKVGKNIEETIKYYCLISTSECATGKWHDKKNFISAALSAALLILGFLILIARLALKKEADAAKKNFLALMLAWIGVFFILSIPVAFQIRPRFYIVIFAVPFILFGFLLKFLQEKFGRRGVLLSAIFALAIILWNCKGTFSWFEEQRLSQEGDLKIKRTLILKTKDGVTLGQLQQAADFMFARHKTGNKLYYYVKAEHVAPIKFLLRQKDGNLQFDTMGKEAEEEAQFFAIIPTGSGPDDFASKFGTNYKVLAEKEIGQLTVFEAQMFEMEPKKPKMFFNRTAGKTDRIFWKDVFGLTKKSNAIEINAIE